MQVRLDLANVVEMVALVGSALLGLIVLAGHYRDRRGRLFGVLCLALAAWKAFDFAHPQLTVEPWVDSASWVLGALCIGMAVHFFSMHSLEGTRYGWPLSLFFYVLSAFFLVVSSLGYVYRSDAWKAAFGLYLLAASCLVVGMMVWKYGRERKPQNLLALVGAASLGLGVCLQVVDIIWDIWSLRTQAYGMLAFEACLGYDILIAGLLRERKKHLKALEELGLREKRLEMAESRFRKMMDTSYDVIFTVDREGNILGINTEAKEVLGFPVERMLGKGYLDYLEPEDRERAFATLARGLGGEKVRFFEITLRRPDGRPVVLSLTGTRLHSEKEAALVIARDVTESKEMERQLLERNALLEEANRRLRELDRLKTELVGIVGHELRSPLTVINSYASALHDHWDKMEDERKMECIHHVLRECDRLNRMVENVLDMTRIESEQLFLNRQPGDLMSVLEDIAREMSMVPASRPLHVVSSISSLRMEADWDKVKQVVINLLDNAFHFSPPGEAVLITAELQDGMATVRVKDRGPGFPRESRDRLFEKFTRSKAAGMERGLGLGLYIVRTFVEAHGGRVWIEDEEGMGAVVAFSLPL